MASKYIKWMPVLAALTALVAAGCGTDSAESISRNVPVNVNGFYQGKEGAPVVARNSGASIITLNILQYGDELQAVDNNGLVFRGTIGDATEGFATITLIGPTTAGNEGQIVGSIDLGSDPAVLTGTWIEDALYSTVYGEAKLPNQPDIVVPSNGTNGIVFYLPGAEPGPANRPALPWMVGLMALAALYLASLRRFVKPALAGLSTVS